MQRLKREFQNQNQNRIVDRRLRAYFLCIYSISMLALIAYCIWLYLK